MFLKLIYSFAFLSLFNQAMAGSCCGGGSSSTELMIGDTKSVWRTHYIDQTILADTDQSGKIKYRPENQLESLRTFSLSFSQRINSFWQWGANIPIVDKTRKIENNWESLSGLGDIKLNIGYEFAYGEEGIPGVIPEKSTLIFEIKLNKIIRLVNNE